MGNRFIPAACWPLTLPIMTENPVRTSAQSKASGRIKYSYDVNRPNMLHGKMVFSPYAHAKVVSIDTSAAEKMPGVKAVEIMTEPGKEVFWEGHEVVAIAAETEEQARDAARRIQVRYEKLPHLASDMDPRKAREHP